MEFRNDTKKFIDCLPKGQRKAILKMLGAIANVFPISVHRCDFLKENGEVIVIGIAWDQLIFHTKKGRRTTLYVHMKHIASDWKYRAIQLVKSHAKYLTGL